MRGNLQMNTSVQPERVLTITRVGYIIAPPAVSIFYALLVVIFGALRRAN